VTDGQLEQVGDHWRLRFTRRLRHSPDQVWRALTEPEHLAAWFPARISGEWTVGGELHFTDPRAPEFSGEVRVVEAPRVLEFTWGTDLLRFEIAPTPDGCTLTLLDTLDEVGKGARDAAGWHVCLDALERALDGNAAQPDINRHWTALHRQYVAEFGPQAATLGPPEGWDS
jgi:uncharacterized protein YndB with AHSA1/START domain